MKRGEVRWYVFPDRQETAGAHFNEGFGVGIPEEVTVTPITTTIRDISLGSLVDQGGRNAEGLRRKL